MDNLAKWVFQKGDIPNERTDESCAKVRIFTHDSSTGRGRIPPFERFWQWGFLATAIFEGEFWSVVLAK